MSATGYNSDDQLTPAEMAEMDVEDLHAYFAATDGLEGATEASPGGRMRLFRERKGLSMRALAQALDTHFTTVAKLESGKMKMTDEWASKLSKPLGFPPAAILASAKTAEAARTIPVFDAYGISWQDGKIVFGEVEDTSVLTLGGSRTFGLMMEFENPDYPAPGMLAVDPDDCEVRPGKIYCLDVEGNPVPTLARYLPDPAQFKVWIKYDRNSIDTVNVGRTSFSVMGRVISVSYEP